MGSTTIHVKSFVYSVNLFKGSRYLLVRHPPLQDLWSPIFRILNADETIEKASLLSINDALGWSYSDRLQSIDFISQEQFIDEEYVITYYFGHEVKNDDPIKRNLSYGFQWKGYQSTIRDLFFDGDIQALNLLQSKIEYS